MSFLSRIHYKAKPAFLFLVVILGMLGSSVLEKHLMQNMNTSVSSLYQDRLLPATGLFQLNDQMYAKRHLLESYLANPVLERGGALRQELLAHNAEITDLMNRYRETYLVADEARVFDSFRARVARYNALETQMLTEAGLVSAEKERELFRQFDGIHADLARLNQIQLRVGQELSNSSHIIEGNATLLSNLKIALLLLFTLAIYRALLLDRHPLLPKSLKNFRLN
ncbi:MCP four helix bundle domain-containing protein [Hymenobacter psychrotolerans]|uniref:Four helix bundle sensory module for signal transduction n=1 Tax=Hymenobacter psychrotolerans DSM 18569 TaxID=1121959 RepID=A0A1M7FGU2_9BACT|nr:MCP four helix bundle domain-containing protein [Hymenobacter psychrotolerans]SHM03008.1 Four helix bundle sensory module for signal transduction [Hymenobacter psychrotolerans DSM 18569]